MTNLVNQALQSQKPRCQMTQEITTYSLKKIVQKGDLSFRKFRNI